MDNLYENSCHTCEGTHFHNEAESSIQLDTDVLTKALRDIYDGLDVKNEIQRDIFEETLRLFNEATVEGLLQSKVPVSNENSFYEQLRTNNEVFSAFRTHRMQNDLAIQLIDKNGKLKSFDKWMRDVQDITDHYCKRWLQTEYDTAILRAHQAADWKQFVAEADVFPNVRWMPTTSPEPDVYHKQYWEARLTLPVNHPFWQSHHPGDRWNCKCSLMQTDEPATTELIADFEPIPGVPGLDNNPANDGKLFSDSHPYYTEMYPGADKAVNKLMQERVKNDEMVFRVDPKTGKEVDQKGKYYIDTYYGRRLTTSTQADRTELEENTRAARVLLESFPKMKIRIREHVHEYGVKNPEYLINGKISDRKGIESEKGITSGFQKAINQGCKVVVIDLDMHMKDQPLRTIKLSGKLYGRRTDFTENVIKECYVIYHGKAVVIDKKTFKGGSERQVKDRIQGLLEKIRE